MGYKCSIQILGLVRGEPKPGQKHRANGQKIAQEAGNERYSKSVTLDRSRSVNNGYAGYKRGTDCWADMCAEADAYRVTGVTKNGREYTRSLRADAVIGYAIIFNPPAEMCVGWDAEKYKKFYSDSFAFLHRLDVDIFRKGNIKMQAVHRDEGLPDENGVFGDHMHVIGEAKDRDGKYCGNRIDAKMCATIAAEYPAFMRARGWPLDDLDTTDWAKYKTDAAYRAERNAKWAKCGRDVNTYASDQAAQMVDQAQDALDQAQKMQAMLQAAQDAQAAEQEEWRDTAWQALGELDQARKAYEQAAGAPDASRDAFMSKIKLSGGQTALEAWKAVQARQAASLDAKRTEARAKTNTAFTARPGAAAARVMAMAEDMDAGPDTEYGL